MKNSFLPKITFKKRGIDDVIKSIADSNKSVNKKYEKPITKEYIDERFEVLSKQVKELINNGDNRVQTIFNDQVTNILKESLDIASTKDIELSSDISMYVNEKITELSKVIRKSLDQIKVRDISIIGGSDVTVTPLDDKGKKTFVVRSEVSRQVNNIREEFYKFKETFGDVVRTSQLPPLFEIEQGDNVRVSKTQKKGRVVYKIDSKPAIVAMSGGGTAGVRKIIAGSNINISGDGTGEVVISSTATGSSGAIVEGSTFYAGFGINITGLTISNIDGGTSSVNVHVGQSDPHVQYVLNTGDTMTGILALPAIQFNTASNIGNTFGRITWNQTDGTIDIGLTNNVTMQVGQELFIRAINKTGVTIPNSSAVYISGSQGNRPTIGFAIGSSYPTADVAGLATEDIPNNQEGFITTFGYVRQIDTTGGASAWSEGDILYLSGTSVGMLTNIPPQAPIHSGKIGIVTNVHQNQGSILVNINKHNQLQELSDVNGTPLLSSGQFPVWNNTSRFFDFDYNINNYLGVTSSTNQIIEGSSNFYYIPSRFTGSGGASVLINGITLTIYTPPVQAGSTVHAGNGLAYQGLTLNNIVGFVGSGGVSVSLNGNTYTIFGLSSAINTDQVSQGSSNFYWRSSYITTAGGVSVSYNGNTVVLFSSTSGGVADGNKGEITVSGSGSTWTINELNKEVVLYKSKVQSGTSAGYVGITSLMFTMGASMAYTVDGFVLYKTGTSAMGVLFGVNAPAGASLYIYSQKTVTTPAKASTDSLSTAMLTTNDTPLPNSTSEPTTTADLLWKVDGVVINAGTSGLFQLRVSKENVAGQYNILAGSYLKYRRVV